MIVCVCVWSLHTVCSSFLQERKSKTGRLQIHREKDSEPVSDLHTPSPSFHSLHPSVILSTQIFPKTQYVILQNTYLFYFFPFLCTAFIYNKTVKICSNATSQLMHLNNELDRLVLVTLYFKDQFLFLTSMNITCIVAQKK